MLTVHAPAKINLFLEVTGRRPDGYHTIETIFQTVGLCDVLTLRPLAKRITLKCSDPSLPTDGSNLVVKAAQLLRQELGVEAGAALTLDKRIPHGAGLGGGSSDAAAVLRALPRLWGVKVPARTLARVALRLGADVPFFLKGGTAKAGGIGEKLTSLRRVAPSWFVLVNPGFPVSTPWVYRNLRFPLTGEQKINKMENLLVSGAPAQRWGRYLYNRLEDVVLAQYSEIGRIRAALGKLGIASLMSGSGSTVFGIVPSHEEGEVIKTKLQHNFKWGVWVVESVS